MNRHIFRHLYSQIVAPLLLGAIGIGIAAAAVSGYFLSDVTDTWTSEVAEGVRQGLVDRMILHSEMMQSLARLISEDAQLLEALESGDYGAASESLARSGGAVAFDNLMLLAPDGRVVATIGLEEVRAGGRYARPDGGSWHELEMPRASFLEIGGVPTLTAMHPVQGAYGRVYTLCFSDAIDEEFLATLTIEAGCGTAFFRDDLSPVAWVASGECDRSGEEGAQEDLGGVFLQPADDVAIALEQAASSGTGSTNATVGGVNHRVVAQRVVFPGGGGEHTVGYLVSLISQQVSDDAWATTANLITMWSIFAVLALVGLGGWVARRVSDPLVAVTDGAQRIADGDFSTKIQVSGKNEIMDLAESFNQMIDSLKDRSDSLTKKVLELATLYEMSRALGATLDMGRLFEGVLDSALRIFGADLGYVTMRNRETGELEIRARSGAVPSRVDDAALRNSMSEWVIREARPLIFNPAGEGSEGQAEVVTGAMAALCVPLVSSEGTVGAITVGSQDPEFRFGSDDVRLLSTIANHVTIAVGNIDLFSSLQEAYLATVRSLAAAVDAKDPYTRGHSEGVAVYCTLIAERIGLSHDQRVALEMAAYLHDIGKIGVKESILLKPGALTADEMSQMRHHPLIGANILKPVAFPWPIVPVVRHHHERWDGEGYPAGLKGEEVPLLARILTVADAYEAMIADRPYRRGRTMEEGIVELESCSGGQFDPTVVQVFVEALAEDAAVEKLEAVPVPDEEVGADEARAIFVALSEGMLLSFRRLGGPRLAANAERDLNRRFAQEGILFEVSSGKMNVSFPSGNGELTEVELMRQSLRLVDHTLGRMSGYSLVDHFYADAVGGLSDRMHRIAQQLDFLPE